MFAGVFDVYGTRSSSSHGRAAVSYVQHLRVLVFVASGIGAHLKVVMCCECRLCFLQYLFRKYIHLVNREDIQYL